MDRLELLGGFRLHMAGVEVVLPSAPQRVVALLALRGPLTRGRLAGTLWWDASQARAQASLRTCLWRIRQVAPALVRDHGGTTGLDTEVGTDVGEIVRTGADVLGGDPPLGHLGTVLDSDGDLLPDWDEAWLEVERERFRQLRLHVLEALADRLADEGRYGLALELALGALRTDPLRESAHRHVIRIHLAEGNVSEAVRALERCRELLDTELGVRPAPATEELVALARGGRR